MTSSPENMIIEHVVLFNVREEEDENDPDQGPTKVNDMINRLNALSSLDSVVYLTAGPILRTRSSPLKFTHMLHARYHTLSDLQSYTVHPVHVAAVESNRPLVEDIMAIDWVADLGDRNLVLTPRPGSAIRFSFFQAEGEYIKEDIFGAIQKLKESMGPYEQVTYGPNFSDRGKGYSVASLVVFPDLNELDACEEYEDQMRSLVDKVKGSLDGFIAVDYVVPRHATVNATTE